MTKDEQNRVIQDMARHFVAGNRENLAALRWELTERWPTDKSAQGLISQINYRIGELAARN